MSLTVAPKAPPARFTPCTPSPTTASAVSAKASTPPASMPPSTLPPALPGRRVFGRLTALLLFVAAIAWTHAEAQAVQKPGAARKGKLLLTGGVSSIEGPAGGGLTPWAVTGTHATGQSLGASAHFTGVKTRGYRLAGYGATIGFGERTELSVARQDFDTADTGTALGLPGLRLRQNILGLKLRLAGDAVLDSDRWWPQFAVGLQYKELNAGGLAPTLTALGAKRQGVDLYASATKLFLGQGLLVNATLRATKANQTGLLGFGGTGHDTYRLMPEVSLAYLLRHDLAIGAEYRWKPDNLNPSLLGAGLREDDWKDLFIAWAPNKHFSLTAAYVDLGRIVPAVAPRRQTGGYVSAQVSY
jgi:Protein of unknown function (DUF3034)